MEVELYTKYSGGGGSIPLILMHTCALMTCLLEGYLPCKKN